MFQIPLQTQCRGHFQYLTSYLFGEVRKPAIRCNAKTRQFGLILLKNSDDGYLG